MTAAMAIIPSSMSGAALLATRYDTSPCDALDAFLIAIGMLESVAPLLFVLRLWARKARGTSPSWVCASTPIEVPPQEEHGRVYTAMRSFVYHTVRRSWKWYRVRHPASGTPQSAQVLLLEYRVLWYPSLDASIVTGVALLTVVGGLNHESPFLCRGSTVLVIFLLLGQLTVIPFFQPFTTRVSHIAAMANAILTTASVVLQFVIVASSHSSVLWLDTASSICNLIVLAISATRMCLDAYDVMFAIKKRVGTTIEKDRTHDVPKLLQQVDEGDTTTLEMCFQATNHEIEENRRDVGGVKDAFELDLDACMDMLMDTAEANDKRGDNEKSFELPPQDDSAFSLLWDDVDTVADATKCHHQNMGEVWSHIRQQARADQGDDSIVEERAHLSFWDKSGRALDAVAAAGSSGNKSGNKRTDGAEEELPSIIASTDTAIRRVTPASRNETENPSSSSSRKEDPGKIGNATRRRGSFRRK
ncbi:membrane-associated protein, putative [Bodo saltans]|uniref:Membrane-associated protein, putative n=1 Tax=Bodo saltans TaxID=75058 RepID=A0A0S4IXY0_BODSA|nr:membrane-associated protein, putative [Bodo saltans]|eukprot:CUF94267.1 membrane-associated protein, putative [Bodo saltans]